MVSGDNFGGILRVVGRRDTRNAPRSVRSTRGHSVTKLKPALFVAPVSLSQGSCLLYQDGHCFHSASVMKAMFCTFFMLKPSFL